MRPRLFRPGILYALLSNTVCSLNAIGIAVIIPNIGVYSIITARYIFLALIPLPCVVKNPEYLTNLSKAECLRLGMGSLAFGSMAISGYLAFEYAPPLDVNALFSTNSAMVMIGACIFLKEGCDLFKVVIVLTILGCIFLIFQPDFLLGWWFDVNPSDRLLGCALAICAAVLSTIGSAVFGKINHLPLPLINLVQGVLISSFTTLIFYNSKSLPAIITENYHQHLLLPTTQVDTLLFVFCAVSESLGRALKAEALKKEESALVTAIGSVSIVMVMVLQITVLGIYPNWFTIFGSLLIVLCIVLLSLKDVIKDQQSSNDPSVETQTTLTS